MAQVAPQENDPQKIEEIQAFIPRSINNQRACIGCRVIMTKEQFVEFGCPTCQDTLSMRGDENRVMGCTSANYRGIVAVMRPGAFVSRFVGLDKRLPGMYAFKVEGTIPAHILNESEYEPDPGFVEEEGGSAHEADGQQGGALARAMAQDAAASAASAAARAKTARAKKPPKPDKPKAEKAARAPKKAKEATAYHSSNSSGSGSDSDNKESTMDAIAQAALASALGGSDSDDEENAPLGAAKRAAPAPEDSSKRPRAAEASSETSEAGDAAAPAPAPAAVTPQILEPEGDVEFK